MVEIRTVGIVGAGQMGTGIAHVCAVAGYEVRLNDLTRQRIDDGLSLIAKNLARQVGRGLMDEATMTAALARIHPAESLADVGSADLAIEAATENEQLKMAVFTSLEPHLAAKT